MELDNLKTLWREQAPAGDNPMDAGMLVQLLQERSRGPIERMRRNLRIESLLMVLTYIPTIAAYFLMFNGHFWGIAVMMAMILVLFWVYYYKKNRLLKKMQCVTCEVRSNLNGQLIVLGKYIRFYLWAGTIVTSLAIIVAYSFLEYTEMTVHHLSSPHWFKLIFLLSLLGPFAVGSYFMNRWYVNKLYGRHIKKLKQLLREMDEV